MTERRDQRQPHTGGATTSSAPHARASDADAPPKEATVADEDTQAEPVRPAPEEQQDARQAQPAAEDHESKVERDLEELAAKAEKADEYLELAQRTKADFENYRKRAVRETAAAQERGMTKLAKELLPAVDNLDRAMEAAQAADADLDAAVERSDNGAAPLVSGIKLVHADVLAALARAGIEPFSPEGEQFDPQHHEAVAHQPVEGAQPGTVVEVYQRGYRLGDTVLRPARVLVAA